MGNKVFQTSCAWLAAVLLPLQFVRADPGALDLAFDAGTKLGTACCTAPWGVASIAVQPDGRVVVGGSFRSFGGDNAMRSYTARLKPDGSLDSNFTAAIRITGPNSGVAIQPDGKILCGGAFADQFGTPTNGLARFDAAGFEDSNFNSAIALNGAINTLALQADGRIVIGGTFTLVNGVARNRIARLNAQGSLDTNFNPGSGANNSVLTCALQADGKVLLGGTFTSVNGNVCNRIARLNPDGSVDASFSPPSGVDDGAGAFRRVLSFVVLPDGKVIVGGWFASVNGLSCTGIVRLDTNGATDTNFSVSCLHQSGLGGDLGLVNAIRRQADGKLVVGGNFVASAGAAGNGVLRLNPDGSLDATFNPGTGASSVSALAIQPDGRIVIGGEFTSVNNVTRYHVARLEGNPPLSLTFSAGHAVLRWPTNATNFALQFNSDLTNPDGWSMDTNPPVLVSNQFCVTNSLGGGGFYRLKK